MLARAERRGMTEPGGPHSSSAVKRPVVVTLVGWLAFGVGTYYIVDGVLVATRSDGTSELTEGATVVALGVLAILIGFGALRVRRWAWAALMTWAVISLMNQLLRVFFFDHPDYPVMALGAVVVLMLTPLDVQIAFGVRRLARAGSPRHATSASTAPPGIESSASDLEILRAVEPVVCFTQGEKFFPMDVERYVEGCSLWLHFPATADEELVAEGSLTTETLVERREAPADTLFYLRFVGPLDLQGSAQALTDHHRLARKQHSEFHAGVGRLVRGGLLPRLGDSLFSLSLLLRGTVPQATAAAAAIKYAAMQEEDDRYVYHGRVVRQGGWTVCQYWLFYAYNPWRSGFHGVNDHEADWELISVYLYEEDGRLLPQWAAFASHDFHGADLRRRFDDGVDLELQGQHPVAYAGAGSHAAYFRPGEYQAEVALPTPTRVKGITGALGRFWRNTLGQGAETRNPLRIPFIDFARGDGLRVGPEQAKQWAPALIDETTSWVSRYRGLWGLYARDPISGENAPAGPMYERDGSPRPSWFDPLGFAGLDRVPPPPRELAALEGERDRVQARQEELERLIPEANARLEELGVRLGSMHGSPHLAAESEKLEELLTEEAVMLTALRKERSENEAILEGLQRGIESRRQGRPEDARAHIQSAAEPVPVSQMRFDRVAEVWAAISISLLFVGLAVLILVAPDKVWALLTVIVVAFVIGESILRRSFLRTVNQIAVLLALIAAVVLFVHIWKYALVALLLGLAVYLTYQRLRELRG
jgi:hypothetical protein